MEEKRMILKMLEDGKITSEEAIKLLEAVGDSKEGRKNIDYKFPSELKDGLNTIARVAKEMFGTTFSELSDTLKDVPGTIISAVASSTDLDYHREFSIRDEITTEKLVIVEGKADSFRFFQSDSNHIKIDGRVFISSKNNTSDVKFPELAVIRENGKLKLESVGNSLENYRIEADIWIPSGIELSCNTKSGNIEANHINSDMELNSKLGKILMDGCVGNAEASTKGGTINIKNHDGNVDADVKNGSLLVEKVVGNIRLSCQNGIIELKQPRGNTTLSSKMGTIAVYFDEEIADGKHEISSKTGIVNLYFKEQSDAKVVANTKVGSVVVDPIFKSNNGLVKIGEGGPEIIVETKVGSINIQKYE
jgi:hypothetical protein